MMSPEEIKDYLTKRIERYKTTIENSNLTNVEEKAIWIRMDECKKILNDTLPSPSEINLKPKKVQSIQSDIKMPSEASELPLNERIHFRVAQLYSQRVAIQRKNPTAETFKALWKIDKLLELYAFVKDLTNKEMKTLQKMYKDSQAKITSDPKYRMANLNLKLYYDELEDLLK